jgi:hypothetical protein
MSADDLAPFAALIGTWDTESTHPLFDGVVTGVQTYEWLEGGKFMVARSHHDHDLFPDGLVVVGPTEQGDGIVAEYFDSRGVRRTYGIAVEDGVMRWWRDHEGFDQRSVAEIGGDEFVLQHQLAETRGEWKDDLRTVYRRRA